MEVINRIVTALVDLHPWHAMIVHYPIALSTVGLLFIFLALWRRSDLFEKVAYFNMILVAISTAVAGLTGMRDNAVRFDGEAPFMNVKFFLGISLLVLSAITALVRWRKPDLLWSPGTRILYIAAYVVCFLLSTVLGFVGGSILYGF